MRPRWIRLFLMPGIVLLGALILWRIGVERASRGADVAHASVARWCSEAQSGGVAPAAIAAASPLIRPQLEAAFATLAGVADVTVEVANGDHPEFGRPDDPATHHALIRGDGRDLFGLRLFVHETKVTVIGLWRPDPTIP
ncbi:MAG: hypothetical protein HKN62_04380 [Phycisphaerales bacterium]|nr:hypothetical protein [Phycisphaerales bacterium]